VNEAISHFLAPKMGQDGVKAGVDAFVLPDEHPNSQKNIARRQALKISERDEFGRLYKGSVTNYGPQTKGQTVTVLARTFTNRAINLLGAVMDDEKAPQAARVTAAQALLDRGWGKAPIQIDLNVRQKFDDFLRDVGLAANYERDHANDAQDVTDVVPNVVIDAALDEQGREDDEQSSE
jgi:hypothetical protein